MLGSVTTALSGTTIHSPTGPVAQLNGPSLNGPDWFRQRPSENAPTETLDSTGSTGSIAALRLPAVLFAQARVCYVV